MNTEQTPFEELVAIMAKLRGENGCPWDREQTHVSLRTNVIEETYEVVEAIDNGDMALLREELGDLLLQVVFHAQLAAEEGAFDINDVAREINEKLIRRHPHIFGSVKADDSAAVLRNWDEIKQEEKKKERLSVLDGVPKDLPALKRAEKYQGKAAKVGFDWDNAEGPLNKVREELEEVLEALKCQTDSDDASNNEKVQEEFGDLLFSMVNWSRFLNVDSELALRCATDKFSSRFRKMESLSKEQGKDLKQMTLEEMDELWEKIKHEG